MTDARPRSFDEVFAQTFGLYRSGRYQEAFEIWTLEGPAFPGRAATIEYLCSCFAARTGRIELAIEILSRSVDAGNWYGERILRESPSLLPLQGNDAFEVVAARSLAIAQRPRPATRLNVRWTTSDAPAPVVIALHSNGSNAESEFVAWDAAVPRNWTLALPESSQVVMSDETVWDDQEIALADLERDYAHLMRSGRVDPARVVLGGFSMGGETVIRAALTQRVRTIGFVVLGPGGPTMDVPEQWRELLPPVSPIRGHMIVGADDDAALAEGARGTVSILESAGVSCGIEFVPGVGHAYPPDFDERVMRALCGFVEP